MDYGACNGPLREADVALEVCILAAAAVRAHGFSVGLTRIDNSGLTVAKRKQLITGDLVEAVISVHANDATSLTVNGHETFVSSFNAESQRLGKSIVASLITGERIAPRKPPIKTRLNSATGKDYYYVIGEPTKKGIPAVMVELGFIRHVKDAAVLGSFWGRFGLAHLLGQGVLNYLGVV